MIFVINPASTWTHLGLSHICDLWSVADPGVANPAMAPHRSWQWSLPHSGAERVMIAL